MQLYKRQLGVCSKNKVEWIISVKFYQNLATLIVPFNIFLQIYKGSVFFCVGCYIHGIRDEFVISLQS